MSDPHPRANSLLEELKVLRAQIAFMRKQIAEHAEVLKWLEEQARRRAA